MMVGEGGSDVGGSMSFPSEMEVEFDVNNDINTIFNVKTLTTL